MVNSTTRIPERCSGSIKSNSYKLWSIEETSRLIELFINDKKTKNEICVILNRPYDSIKKKLKQLNLFCSKDQIAKSKRDAMTGIKNPMFGKSSWSKGLTKENNDSLKKASQKQSKTKKELFENGLLRDISGENNPMFGKKPWCKGLTKDTNDTLRLASKKSSVIQKEIWKNLPPSEREKRVKQLRIALKACMDKRPRSSIEIKIESFLKDELHLIFNEDYIPQLPKDSFIFDFYFPKLNIVLECQGDYFHANPNKYTCETLNSTQKANIKRDERKIQYLLNNNIKHLFVWEFDIKQNFNDVKNSIKAFLK